MSKNCSNCLRWYDGACTKIIEYEDRHDLENDNFAIFCRVSDDSGLELELLTGPEFYCSQHETREYDLIKEENIGRTFLASDGGNYGIFIVGYLEDVDDYVVMPTIGSKIDYSKEPYRIDAYKATYRYGVPVLLNIKEL